MDISINVTSIFELSLILLFTWLFSLQKVYIAWKVYCWDLILDFGSKNQKSMQTSLKDSLLHNCEPGKMIAQKNQWGGKGFNFLKSFFL